MTTGDAVLDLFPDDAGIDRIFYKLLSQNDDSGRHGVLIAPAAYGFFPEIPDFDPTAEENYTVPITTVWREPSGWQERESAWKHYHRYPERRITALYPVAVNVDEPTRLLVIGRSTVRDRYYCVVLTGSEPGFGRVAQLLRIDAGLIRPGLVSGVTEPTEGATADRPIDILTAKLMAVARRGYVPTMRPGDTGIGYTLETLLGIDANSSKSPDFMGIEIKASRSKSTAARRARSMTRVTLLAKTPEWGENGDRVGLLDRHGYWDDNGRWSLYMSIYAGHPNAQGWTLLDRHDQGRLSAARGGIEEVYWPMASLEERLREKHRESVFVTAHAKVIDGVEHFWYDSMTYGRDAGLPQFLTLVGERAICHDFALHRTETGGVRDHGFLFRITKDDIPRLFSVAEVKDLA